MTSISSHQHETRCNRCRRVLTSAASIAAGTGRGCAAKIRKAARETALEGLNDKQRAEAVEMAADGCAVPLREGIWKVTSSTGEQAYITTADGHCSCPWGLRRTTVHVKPCKHVGVVRLMAVTPRRSRLAKAA